MDDEWNENLLLRKLIIHLVHPPPGLQRLLTTLQSEMVGRRKHARRESHTLEQWEFHGTFLVSEKKEIYDGQYATREHCHSHLTKSIKIDSLLSPFPLLNGHCTSTSSLWSSPYGISEKGKDNGLRTDLIKWPFAQSVYHEGTQMFYCISFQYIGVHDVRL